MQSAIGKNAYPADTAQIDLYHVDAGFFMRFMRSQIFLRAPSEILFFLAVARTAGSSVAGRSAAVDAAFDLNEQNIFFIFANNIGLQMTAAIIAMQNRITS